MHVVVVGPTVVLGAEEEEGVHVACNNVIAPRSFFSATCPMAVTAARLTSCRCRR